MSNTQDAARFAHLPPPNANIIINGGFNVWQRHLTNVSPASGTAFADRWRLHHIGVSAFTTGRTNGPVLSIPESGGYYAATIVTTTADASIAATDGAWIGYRVEGIDAAKLHLGESTAAKVTLSFWHLHTVTGTYCVQLKNDADDRSYIVEYTQDVTDTWEKEEITIQLDTTGTWLYTAGVNGLELAFAMALGTNFHGTKDVWQAGDKRATSNQVNGISSVTNKNQYTGVKLEIGETATPYQDRPYAEELALCQRYYEKSYSQTSYPGDVATSNMEWLYQSGLTSGTLTVGGKVQFAVSKSHAPDVLTYSPVTGTSGKARDNAATAADVNTTVADKGNNGFRWSCSTNGAKTTATITFQWDAEADF